LKLHAKVQRLTLPVETQLLQITQQCTAKRHGHTLHYVTQTSLL